QGGPRLGTADGGTAEAVFLFITNGLIHGLRSSFIFSGRAPVLSGNYYSKSCANSASRSFCRPGQFPVQIAKKSKGFFYV
ncbi:hypothetical protein, partial [Oscillibacter sp.]|uniref:hypothetical protein n=1 Tax=Oscillibacter sp. TaxID=1945593 RepID=UPI002D7EE5F3